MNSNTDIRKRTIWNPARFTHSHASMHYDEPFAVVILNQPLEDKALLVDVCSRGSYPGDIASRRLC